MSTTRTLITHLHGPWPQIVDTNCFGQTRKQEMEEKWTDDHVEGVTPSEPASKKEKKGVTAVFDNDFMPTPKGREAYFATLTSPAFIKATTEFTDALFPHGMCISADCLRETKEAQKREYEEASKTERWGRVVPPDETPRSCVQCGKSKDTVFKSMFLTYVRLCQACYTSDEWKKVVLFA
jgi:hypothetical protein